MEPLERGYGITLGNSLRRVLLSSLPGAAPKSVKIDGVLHEFSTLPGVKEDVVEIILNLKEVAVKLHSDEPVVGRIDVEGKGEVTAGHIKGSADIEILNPDHHIATLSDDGKLHMEIVFVKGKGYVPSDKTKSLTNR
ncbi:RNA polymerase insert [Thermoanaerobacter ethanolicus JW 200]|nr:RNA polymerase insert [Thermoanaerobacter ethanolicus JW 200]